MNEQHLERLRLQADRALSEHLQAMVDAGQYEDLADAFDAFVDRYEDEHLVYLHD